MLEKCRVCKEVKDTSEFRPTKSKAIFKKPYNDRRKCLSCEKSRYQKTLALKRFKKCGLTLEQLESLRAIDHCAICESPNRLCIDHNHQTNKIRGVLCSSCNSLLGFAKDDIIILQRAIEYLQSTP